MTAAILVVVLASVVAVLGGGRETMLTRDLLAAVPESKLQTVGNYNDLYTWQSELFEASTAQELLNKVQWCKDNNVQLRVRGAGWSVNKFLDPTSANGQPGVNIVLQGDFLGVKEFDEETGTIKVGAGTKRGPLYEALYRYNRSLLASGECFTLQDSQVVGGLIANSGACKKF